MNMRMLALAAIGVLGEGLAARYMAWTRRPGEFVFPYECDPSYGE